MMTYFSITTTSEKDIWQQLESLRHEVRELGLSIFGLRQDDLRTVFGGQIASVLDERIERFFTEQRQLASDRAALDKIEIDTKGLVRDVIDLFQMEGKDKAMEKLDEHVLKIHGLNLLLESSEIPSFLFDIVQQMRSYFTLSDTIFQTNARTKEPYRPQGEVLKERGPDFSKTAEDILGPLASSWRLELLRLISLEEDGLAGLSRKMGLKKGHLQFHIGSLMDAGYIRYDKKGHIYLITRKGKVALEMVGRLVDAVQEEGTDPHGSG